MLSGRQVAEIENSTRFRTIWAPYALIDTDVRIRAVNSAYERASAHPRDAMVGRPLFEVFPPRCITSRTSPA
ncbi:PAS domain-containing protein [Mycobacterium sp. Lab-001]|uniref:PAS domain-containing protein n=1 Tax=Mycobacterium sp. Lab-001 TaxID=3410136 RepID=UPI003D183E09